MAALREKSLASVVATDTRFGPWICQGAPAMSDMPANTAATGRPLRGAGAAALTLGGLAAAFGAASCCALPILLSGAGLGTAWLGGVAELSAPLRLPVLSVSAVS